MKVTVETNRNITDAARKAIVKEDQNRAVEESDARKMKFVRLQKGGR